VYRDVEWFKANLKADHSDPLLLTRPVAASLLEWLRPLAGKESWDFFCWSDLGIVCGEVKALLLEHAQRVIRAVKIRLRRLVLRKIQQPRVLRRLRGRQIDCVLILCYGNICRSPLAEVLAARQYPEVTFISAGFHKEIDRRSPEFVLAEAERQGVDLSGHRSKCVDARMIEKAQMVALMDERNYERLKQEFPEALEKTIFLGMLQPKPALEIRDPYDAPETMPDVAEQMKQAIARLGAFLRQG
jgi:protein-tyrosine-phosphatase